MKNNLPPDVQRVVELLEEDAHPGCAEEVAASFGTEGFAEACEQAARCYECDTELYEDVDPTEVPALIRALPTTDRRHTMTQNNIKKKKN